MSVSATQGILATPPATKSAPALATPPPLDRASVTARRTRLRVRVSASPNAGKRGKGTSAGSAATLARRERPRPPLRFVGHPESGRLPSQITGTAAAGLV